MQRRIEETIDALLAAEIAPGGPGAAIAVIRDGQFIHRKAYGLANIEWDVPLQSGLRLPHRLAHQAVYSRCDHDVGRARTAVDRSANRDLFTRLAGAWAQGHRARHLPSSTPRVSGATTAAMVDRTLRPNPPVDEVLQLIHAGDFEFELGDRHSYNNSGYLLLGAIIRAVTGPSLRGLHSREAIFEPPWHEPHQNPAARGDPRRTGPTDMSGAASASTTHCSTR